LVEPQQKELFFRRIGEIELGFYVARKVKSPDSLPFVGLFDRAMSDAERQLLRKAKLEGAPAIYRTHAWSSVYYALHEGLGYGVLPSFYDGDSKGIVRISSLPVTKTP